MKHNLLTVFALTSFLVLTIPRANAQEKGEPILKIFGNYHHGISEQVAEQTAFEITRAYLGYRHQWSTHWKAEIKLDIGSPDDVSQYSLIRRYAYFKNAYIHYNNDQWNVGVGLVDMLHISIPERYWGHRYIMKDFQDAYQFGPKADIGAFGMFKATSWLSVDGFMVNGEGYKNLQRDNVYRYGGGLSVYPYKGLILRVHYDLAPKESTQQNLSLFAGFQQANKYSIGLLGVYQINANFQYNKDLFGYSVFGMYSFAKQWEVFLRYDTLRSSLLAEMNMPWALSDDGSALVGGIQYTVTDFLKVSVNYQDWYGYAKNGVEKSYLFVNMEIAL